MTIYLLKCQNGRHNYWRMVTASLACTRDEVLWELARKADVPMLHVAGVEIVPDEQVAMLTGQEWIDRSPEPWFS